MDLAEATIRSIDWTRFRISTGIAAGFDERLLRLLRSRNADESRAAWRNIENSVFSQDTVFDAAEPTIDVIMAALVDDRSTHVKAAALDLLFLLLNGSSDGDPNLSLRCRERALRGSWLLVHEAVTGPQWVRDAVLEVLELVDPVQAQALRTWLDS